MRKTAFFICIALLLPLVCVFATADTYGEATMKLTITHINESAYHEGAAIIYTKSDDGTIGPYGEFKWWYIASFQWDNASNSYVVVETSTEMNVAKGTISIPENGFVYCVTLGNDYPSLGDNTKPNYVNEPTSKSCELVQKLKAGDKAYVYGTDLKNAIIKNNGADWYKPEYKSESFIKIGSEESGMTAYNPNNASAVTPGFVFGVNAVNTIVTEGQVLLLTPSYGKSVDALGNNYDWCKVAVFDWSSKDGAYVVKSIDTTMGVGMQKSALIPPNGFAIAVNLGNNYPALGMPGPNYTNDTATNVFNNLSSIEVGRKAYLTGINIKNGTFEYEGNISEYYSASFKTNGFIHIVDEKPENCYEPNTEDILATPEFNKRPSAMYLKGDIKLSWKAVDGADKYFITLFDSTINTNGASILTDEVSATEITVPGKKLTAGSTYTARIYATGNGKGSEIAEYSFIVCSERALTSKFRGKTIVAFGDSITDYKGWVAMLEGEFGCEVINSGVAGNRTTHALERIQKDVLDYNPDLVIINFGMNDQAIDPATGTNLTPIEQYEANYRNIIKQVQDTGAEIILVAVHDVCKSKYGATTVPYYDRTDDEGVTYVDRYNEVVKKLANELDLGFLDINSKAQNILDAITSDGIHLSNIGQKKYLEWISNYCFEFVDKNTDWVAPPALVLEDEDDNTSDAESSNANETSETEDSDDSETKKGGMKTWQLVLTICLLFAGISVFGVLFLKTIKKNKKI